MQWPIGWPRTDEYERKRAAFSYKPFGSSYTKPLTFEVATRHLYEELKRLGATDIILSSNLKLRNDMVPYSKQGRIEDPGIAVYFKYKSADQCIPCDKWDRPEDNIRAIAKTIEAIRGIERWGAKEMVDAAFRGFKALPAPDDIIPAYPQYFADCTTEAEIKTRFKKLAKEMHPDSGGTHDQFTELVRQYQQRVK